MERLSRAADFRKAAEAIQKHVQRRPRAKGATYEITGEALGVLRDTLQRAAAQIAILERSPRLWRCWYYEKNQGNCQACVLYAWCNTRKQYAVGLLPPYNPDKPIGVEDL